MVPVKDEGSCNNLFFIILVIMDTIPTRYGNLLFDNYFRGRKLEMDHLN